MVRRALAAPAFVPGYVRVIRGIRSSKVAVIAHHGVTEMVPTVPNGCQVPAEAFAAQMDFLAEHYRVLPLAEVLARLTTSKPLPPRAACLTFDDGFRNVATTAFPILSARQIPSTVFLVTAFVGTRQPAWPDRLYHAIASTGLESVMLAGEEHDLTTPSAKSRAHRRLVTAMKPMPLAERESLLDLAYGALGHPEVSADSCVATLNWDEIERVAQSGLVSFGSHTHTHPILSRCPVEVQRNELARSREILRARGLSADLFAYPNGTAADFTADTRALLKQVGYRFAVSMMPGLNPVGVDPYVIRRIGVGADTTLHDFALRMAGL